MDQTLYGKQSSIDQEPAALEERNDGDILRAPVVIGAGPVGVAVADRLVATGRRPTVMTRSGVAIGGADARRADVADPTAAIAAIEGASLVFQCAQPPYHRWSKEFRPLQDAIIDGCAATGAALVVVDNLYGYGAPDGPITEDTALDPNSRKGSVRAAAWNDLRAAHEAGQVRTAAVRASDFVGPDVESAFGERCFGALVAGRPAQLLGPADVRHSMTYVPDVAAAMVRVAERDAFGRAWHAPTNRAEPVAAVIARAADIAGVRPRSTVVPRSLLRLVGLWNRGARETIEMLYQFDRDFVLDSTHSEQQLGLAPTPMDEVLESTISWYRSAR